MLKTPLTYAQYIAVDIVKGRRSLRSVEIELKSRHAGWRVYYAVVRALKNIEKK
jgi:hypothetical protein